MGSSFLRYNTRSFTYQGRKAPSTKKDITMAINAPEGTRDLLPDEALFWNQFKQTAAEVFGAYGYLPIETPIMEQTELFVRGIGEATV